MKKLLSMFLCAMMAFSLVGCGGGSSSDASTYTFSSELDIKNLDSSDADDGCSFTAMHACIEGLTGVAADGTVQNALADSHTVSEDGLTHTYTIKENANWSNGDPVTAHDFVYAWTRILKNVGNYYYMLGPGIADIKGADVICGKLDNEEAITDEDYANLGFKAVDDKTLEVTTNVPVSFFDQLMAFPCFYPINQKFAEEKGESYAKSADGVLSCGAFKMTKWEPGAVAEFEKNPEFYDADSVKLEKLVMKLVQDPTAAATAFQNGETDFAPINSSLVDKYKDDESFTLINDGYLFYLQVNVVGENKALANANIRKAISLAINREELCDTVLKDGSAPAGGFVPSGLATSPEGKDFREQAGTYTKYDLTEAQAALDAGLAELGVSEITIKLLHGNDESPMDLMAQFISGKVNEELKGLKMELVPTTKQDRIYNKQHNGDFEISCTRWGPDYADPTTYLQLAVSGNSNNYGKWSNAQYDALYDSVSVNTDASARWQEMIDAEKILLEDYADIPVFEKGTATLQNKAVKGLIIKPVGVPYTFTYITK